MNEAKRKVEQAFYLLKNSFTCVAVLFSADQCKNSCKQFARYKLLMQHST